MENRKNTVIYTAYEDYESFDPAVPEKSLLKALLLSAISDLKKTGDVGRKAREYFLDPSEDYIFSFQTVCSFLNVDPKKILYFVGLKHKPIEQDEMRRAVQ